MSLIVLFAILSIMLFEGMRGKESRIDGLTSEQRDDGLKRFGDHAASVRSDTGGLMLDSVSELADERGSHRCGPGQRFLHRRWCGRT